ncbi:pyroglutamyl-peptidase I [Kitasatospora sp. NPDC052896]|uniref:pyroglutamyl-peptidase I n=1 Tax=Kitasatospora sp. NPDC052896 TaxID=3364061 RepID=UPI0037C5B7CE
MTRVLITGFEPFDGAEVNPSWEAVSLVAADRPAGLEITAVRLSCVFGTAREELRAAIEAVGPDLALGVGQAGGRPDITLERVAINVDDARVPDNAGHRPVDQPIVVGGPAAYFSTLPIKACVAALRTAGVPASVSQTAGTYVCNHVFYGLMHHIATELPTLRGGFVHVPFAPEQVVDRAAPSLPVALTAAAIRTILLTATATRTDLPLAAGATH